MKEEKQEKGERLIETGTVNGKRQDLKKEKGDRRDTQKNILDIMPLAWAKESGLDSQNQLNLNIN